MRGWKSATSGLETMRNNLETKLGEKLFLIADARDRASEISFYLRDKRAEGPGHPPVYIPESQDMVNQFSFWPRYDEFVEVKPGAPRPESEVYTEENGINLFVGRDALFIRDGQKATRAAQYQSGLSIDGAGWHDSSIALREAAANLASVSLSKLPDTSAMRSHLTSSQACHPERSEGPHTTPLATLGKQRDTNSAVRSLTPFGMTAPCTSIAHQSHMTRRQLSEISVIVPLFNEEQSVPVLQTELSAALRNSITKSFLSMTGRLIARRTGSKLRRISA